MFNASFICFPIITIGYEIIKIREICFFVFFDSFLPLCLLYSPDRIRYHMIDENFSPMLKKWSQCSPVNSRLIRIVQQKEVILFFLDNLGPICFSLSLAY